MALPILDRGFSQLECVHVRIPWILHWNTMSIPQQWTNQNLGSLRPGRGKFRIYFDKVFKVILIPSFTTNTHRQRHICKDHLISNTKQNITRHAPPNQDLSPFKLHSCRMPHLWEVTPSSGANTCRAGPQHPWGSRLPVGLQGQPDALRPPMPLPTILVALGSFRENWLGWTWKTNSFTFKGLLGPLPWASEVVCVWTSLRELLPHTYMLTVCQGWCRARSMKTLQGEWGQVVGSKDTKCI